jgi:bifunctional non-homologous end joining protein LigD
MKLLSRRGNADLVLDGALALLDDIGRAQFQSLRRRALMRDAKNIAAAARETPAAVFAFDVLQLRARICALPLLTDPIVYCQHIGDSGEKLFQAPVIGKKADSTYRAGRTPYQAGPPKQSALAL